jgi:hypothetical protein
MGEVPRQFHFVFGLREQTEPLHALHYACLESCRQVNQPDAIHFHYRNEPHGPLWDLIRPHLTLHRLGERPPDYDPSRYAHSAEGRFIAHMGLGYAHESDFVRLDALIEHGGVYADMDTLFVKPYPPAWYAHEFLMGEEPGVIGPGGLIEPSLCNAVMFARRGARFARAWREGMGRAFDGTWSRHSCQEAARLWGEQPETLRVLPEEYFFGFRCTRAGLKALLEDDVPVPESVHSIHLWAHLWWASERTDFTAVHSGHFDLDSIRGVDRTINRIVRRFLPPALA